MESTGAINYDLINKSIINYPCSLVYGSSSQLPPPPPSPRRHQARAKEGPFSWFVYLSEGCTCALFCICWRHGMTQVWGVIEDGIRVSTMGRWAVVLVFEPHFPRTVYPPGYVKPSVTNSNSFVSSQMASRNHLFNDRNGPQLDWLCVSMDWRENFRLLPCRRPFQ